MHHTKVKKSHKFPPTGITIFKDHNSTKLEEWLTDMDTAVHLTRESQDKLAKAKSRGLTCTLVMEAINSENTWDEIKDLPRLKLCNANIHTYTSCFMDIQQWEKESLAPCVHWFKMEAKHCNFTNDTTTIRIFVKGLRNPHSLAARIYEEDPQTVNYAFTEVEKLNAAQQLTTTILPSSMVNMMLNMDDQCFQCQEPGHIT